MYEFSNLLDFHKKDPNESKIYMRQGRTSFTFLVNRVEHQNEPKRSQSGGRLGSFWCSTRPLADTGTDYNLHHGDQYLFMPKAELITKTIVAVWVRFGVQLGSLEK